MTDFDTIIQRYQETLDITSSNHFDRADRLYSLGLGYEDRYQKTKTTTDLDTAIQ